jgi:hypothetical protein
MPRVVGFVCGLCKHVLPSLEALDVHYAAHSWWQRFCYRMRRWGRDVPLVPLRCLLPSVKVLRWLKSTGSKK